jgi:hypothetical protein
MEMRRQPRFYSFKLKVRRVRVRGGDESKKFVASNMTTQALVPLTCTAIAEANSTIVIRPCWVTTLPKSSSRRSTSSLCMARWWRSSKAQLQWIVQKWRSSYRLGLMNHCDGEVRVESLSSIDQGDCGERLRLGKMDYEGHMKLRSDSYHSWRTSQRLGNMCGYQ